MLCNSDYIPFFCRLFNSMMWTVVLVVANNLFYVSLYLLV